MDQRWLRLPQQQPMTSCKRKVQIGDAVALEVNLTTLEEDPKAQPIPFEIIFEDDALLIVNKPAGLVVHPGAGQPDQTLEMGCFIMTLSLPRLPRAGLIHRIDKDTSGLLCVAKTLSAYHF